MDPWRLTRLRGLFAKTIKGEASVTVVNARTFLEAVCSQDDPAVCIQRLIGSPYGMKSLQTALGCDHSIPFLNGSLTTLLQYLQSSELRTLCAGALLYQVIDTVVQVSVLWQAYVAAAIGGRLTEVALEVFSWILLLLVSSTRHDPLHVKLGGNAELQRRFLAHPGVQVHNRAHRIIHIVTMVQGNRGLTENGPGGRHDNDFDHIQSIRILPTADELFSEDAYLPLASDVEDVPKERNVLQAQLDRQFRLLREDMIHDLREEIINIEKEDKNRKRKKLKVTSLSLAGITCDEKRFWTLQFECIDGLPQAQNLNIKQQKKFIQENRNYLKNESVGCLVVNGGTFLSLATIFREEKLLEQRPAVLCLGVPGSHVEKVLLRAKASQQLSFVQLDTPIFSYEPILKQLKEIKELPLVNELFCSTSGTTIPEVGYHAKPGLAALSEHLQKDNSTPVNVALHIPKQIRLDSSQAQCFMAGVQQKLSLIQGPPGTGKSFIGSLIAKAIRDFSEEKILVVCYTHHAVDQFLEELLDLGISTSDIVRLGNAKKATQRTSPLSLWDTGSRHKFTSYQVGLLKKAREAIKDSAISLAAAFTRFQQTNLSKADVLEHLEFRSEGPQFFAAFEVPTEDGDMTRVGARGRKVDGFYLFDRWRRGKDAGVFQKDIGRKFSSIWNMRSDERIAMYNQWRLEILETISSYVRESGEAYDQALLQLRAVYMEKDLEVIRQKRIIACTTTAAAKYVKQIQSVAPGVVLVEEAGEILESHILTALSPETKQLILIGDHKQLRPKVNNYRLSVENGDGYDLNRSLFERLVLKGFPHQVLSQQHRMRPELSALIRKLTYPELSDAPNTHGRPDLRGFTANMMFVDHRQPENDILQAREWRDGFSPSSKKNVFESEMTLKCVRYLGQQGYGTADIVILTPYLGQLRLLADQLSKTTDPVLSDLDSYDLVRAGLMPELSANIGKPKIRISTIDNFQGDESDIVIVSLARSNERHDIGFLSSPERVNVMLSRARNALIMIGNSETLMGSMKGGELWRNIINVFKLSKQMYGGFPVRCEQHPKRTAVLENPSDFDEQCPDGGCQEPCTSILSCGVHPCPQRCHQLFDHSKMLCERVVETRCKANHTQLRKCHHSKGAQCNQCKRDNEAQQKDLQHELDMQKRRDQDTALHTSKMEVLDRDILRIRDELYNKQGAGDRAKALEQRKQDLEALKESLAGAPLEQVEGPRDQAAQTTHRTTVDQPAENTSNTSVKALRSSASLPLRESIGPVAGGPSPAELEWERQKRAENARNDAIDNIMSLTGLEDVKTKILVIKAKTDAVQRQGTGMTKERLGMVMLGNPGTGKTTVARQYARFLTSVGALNGSGFAEATGSRLANEGVNGTQKMIDALTKSGGGVFFLDEAYQLTSGDSYGGGAVLDFLLTEIEERVGSIVFVFAGYTKEMEKFFEHNPGLDSRLPHRLTFADYENAELLTMLKRYVDHKYAGQARLEDGPHGPYTSILIDRLGRSRGTSGFGNARSLHNAWSRVTERQAQRLAKERKDGLLPDDFFFAKEDLIGSRPTDVIQSSRAWKELQGMTGLKAVKDSILSLIRRVDLNYLRELNRKPIIEVSLNRIFLGSPGTGKTSVGKLYATILADIGLLSKNEVVVKTPADFVGSVIGESEKNTKAILKATEGKVLMIDEAYGLFARGGAGTGSADPYKTAIIDTIVGEVQSTPGEDRCVLLLGYEDQIKEMLDQSNPGLARRFPVSEAFRFEDFNDAELREILAYKLKKQGLEATDEAKDVAIGVLSRARDRPNFGNAGEVENLISRAKAAYQSRSLAAPRDDDDADVLFLPRDFDPDFDRVTRSDSLCARLFADIVGGEEWIKAFVQYQRMTLNLKARNRDPKEHVPFNFVFKGPSGTGKTTVARKVAEFYYELGILSTQEYVECSASDLIAQYVGQSGPRTREALTKALGKVLFVDEAYRLCDGPFGKEAVDELVDSVTKPQFKGKVVVILAGYIDDIDRLLKVNHGLASRFPTELIFENMKPTACLELLDRQLTKIGVSLSPHCRDDEHPIHTQLIKMLEQLAKCPSWGNGRDVLSICKALISTILARADESTEPLIATGEDVIAELKLTLSTQKARNHVRLVPDSITLPPTDEQILSGALLRWNPASATTTKSEPGAKDWEERRSEGLPKSLTDVVRDPGVSDDIWRQLQADKIAQEAAARLYDQKIHEHEQAISHIEGASTESASEVARLEKLAHDADAEVADELKRKREEERLRLLGIMRKKQELEAKLKQMREEEDARKKMQSQIQQKLKTIGSCPLGFRWIKQAGGYRCAGGSHFVTDAQLGL